MAIAPSIWLTRPSGWTTAPQSATVTHGAVAADLNAGGGRDPPAFLEAERDAGTRTWRLADAGPADLGCSGLEHDPQPLVVEVPQPEFHRVGADRRGYLVDV